jgi:pyridoxine/pyridoxamine 5'-phosphate oxidase
VIWLERLSKSLQQEYPDRGAVGVLATVSPEAEPAARCVICRGVKADGRLSFATDLRSDQIDHLRNQPAAEVVFWLASQKLQWRIAGDVRIITGHPVAAEWADFTEATRQTFFGPPPGEPYEPFTIDADLSTPPPTFAVLDLLPDRVESLDLATTPHTRLRYVRHEKWLERRINP